MCADSQHSASEIETQFRYIDQLGLLDSPEFVSFLVCEEHPSTLRARSGVREPMEQANVATDVTAFCFDGLFRDAYIEDTRLVNPFRWKKN